MRGRPRPPDRPRREASGPLRNRSRPRRRLAVSSGKRAVSGTSTAGWAGTTPTPPNGSSPIWSTTTSTTIVSTNSPRWRGWRRRRRRLRGGVRRRKQPERRTRQRWRFVPRIFGEGRRAEDVLDRGRAGVSRAEGRRDGGDGEARPGGVGDGGGGRRRARAAVHGLGAGGNKAALAPGAAPFVPPAARGGRGAGGGAGRGGAAGEGQTDEEAARRRGRARTKTNTKPP